MAAGWILIPALAALRDEFNRLAPDRDHASDGTIGDAAHQAEVSDHNDDEVGSVPIHDADSVHEVHALDVDSDLRIPGLNMPGLSMEVVVQFLLGRCRSGAETRLRYIIYNRRIWSASSGWQQETYTGASAHTEHAHFSGSYVTAKEASVASWHLEDIPVALTADDKAWIADQIAAVVAKTWAYKLDVDVTSTGENLQPAGSILRYTSSEHHRLDGKLDNVGEQLSELISLVGATSQPPPAGVKS